MKFHHIGFATKNIQASIETFEALGNAKLTEVITDPVQGVQLCFLALEGQSTIELVAPLNENSPVNKYLSKNGSIPYHFCYEVTDITESIKALKKLRYVLVLKPTPAIAFNNRLITFLYHPDTGLIELLQQ